MKKLDHQHGIYFGFRSTDATYELQRGSISPFALLRIQTSEYLHSESDLPTCYLSHKTNPDSGKRPETI